MFQGHVGLLQESWVCEIYRLSVDLEVHSNFFLVRWKCFLSKRLLQSIRYTSYQTNMPFYTWTEKATPGMFQWLSTRESVLWSGSSFLHQSISHFAFAPFSPFWLCSTCFSQLSPSLHLSLSLSLSPFSLCLYWFCGSVRSMLLALFDRGSEMESQAAKWNQSLFFPSLALFPHSTATSENFIGFELCVCEMSSLCSDCQPIFVPLSWFQLPMPLFSHLPNSLQFNSYRLCGCQKLTSFQQWLIAQVCSFPPWYSSSPACA